MCIVCMANNMNRNVYMYINTRIFPTTGYARVLLFMFIRRELAEERYRMFISVYILCFYNQQIGISWELFYSIGHG